MEAGRSQDLQSKLVGKLEPRIVHGLDPVKQGLKNQKHS